MLIAVMSDLHDNVAAWNLIKPNLVKRGIVTLLNCGDTCSPAMLKEMAHGFAGQIYTIFGNVADRELELEAVKRLPNVAHYGDQADFVLEGKKIAMSHFPEVAESLARGGSFDLVCHGHTHLKRWEKFWSTWVLNPGTAGGMFQYPSYAILDLSTMTCEFQEVKA